MLGLVGAGLLAVFASQFQAPHQLALKLDPASYDFGVIKPDQIVTHKFILTNILSRPVRIDEIRPSCGCTTVQTSRWNLAPKQSAQLLCHVNTTGARNDLSTTFAITFHEEGDRLPAYVIAGVHGTIDNVVKTDPVSLAFHSVHPISARITIRSAAASVRVTDAQVTSRALLPRVAPDGKAVDVSFDPKPMGDAETVCQLILTTTCPTEGHIVIPVTIARR